MNFILWRKGSQKGKNIEEVLDYMGFGTKQKFQGGEKG